MIKDIVWPDNSHVPPPGVPEKFHIRTGGEMLLKIRKETGIFSSFLPSAIMPIVPQHIEPCIRITFLEEPPFILVSEPDPVTGRCTMNRGVACSGPG